MLAPLVFALLTVSGVAQSRVVPLDHAPYVPRSVPGDQEGFSYPREVELTPRDAAKSVIHNRVTRHIRAEEVSPIRRRATPDYGGITDFGSGKPQPVRGQKGAPFLWTTNEAIDEQNIDNVSPPPTDAGVVPNLKWSFSLSHTRLLKGGWVREQVVTDLPVSKQISAAEQRLAPYAYRELHWHRVAEWAYVLNGTVRITGNDEDGRNYVADVRQGDLWNFPQGVPHSLQAGPNGAEYLLVFDDADFDASGTTFMVDDWITHTPTEILAQNFGWNETVFNSVPSTDPYIVPADSWPTLEEAKKVVGDNKEGQVGNPYTYELSKKDKIEAPGGGGWVKIVDRKNFPSSDTLAAALVHVKPGALRELHWHKQSEWGYIISGKGRTTAFTGGATARTFDLQAGDTWSFATNWGHYIKAVGDEPLVFLEIFRAGTFGQPTTYNDFPLSQWLALTPPEIVARNLNVSIDLVKQLKQEKQVLIAPRR